MLVSAPLSEGSQSVRNWKAGVGPCVTAGDPATFEASDDVAVTPTGRIVSASKSRDLPHYPSALFLLKSLANKSAYKKRKERKG